MEILSLKCPQCAGDLKIVGPNHAMCKHCGSSFLLGNEGESVKDATASGFYGEFPEYGQGFVPAKFFSDFAAKHQGEQFKDIFVGETLTPDHIEESIRYFKVPQTEPVYLVVDTSIFNTGRVGFACCETGIYYREDVEHPGSCLGRSFPLSMPGACTSTRTGISSHLRRKTTSSHSFW